MLRATQRHEGGPLGVVITTPKGGQSEPSGIGPEAPGYQVVAPGTLDGASGCQVGALKHRRRSRKLPLRSLKLRTTTPKIPRRSPELAATTPEHRRASPKLWHRTPKHRRTCP
jgi:hypothetical protein